MTTENKIIPLSEKRIKIHNFPKKSETYQYDEEELKQTLQNCIEEIKKINSCDYPSLQFIAIDILTKHFGNLVDKK